MIKAIKKIDIPLLIVSILLFSIGLIMIFSSSNVTAFMKQAASPYHYFIKQSIFLIVGIIASLIVIKFHTKGYHIIFNLLAYAVGASLFLLLIYGSVKNKAISWIDLGIISIQPSEFAKIIVIGWIASYYEKYKNKLSNYAIVFFPILICVAIAGLIFAQPDFGTMIIFSLIVAVIFFLAPIDKQIKNKSFLLILGGLIIILLVILFGGKNLLNSTQMKRFDFTDPCSTEKFYSTGNQVCNGYIAIHHGNLTGVGLGNSTQKYLYLPEAHTDFIFAIIVEELGLIGAGVIFILYFLLIGRILKIAKDCYNTRGYLICMGVAFYIIIHIFINLGGVLGIMPMTGVPLPFMSYGGSFALCLVIALTMVQRVNVENKMYKEKNNKSLKK